MEYWYLSLAVLIVGTIFVLFAKQKYKFRTLAIFLLISTATLAAPVIKTIYEGSATVYNTNLQLFSQKLAGIIDPASGFFMGILSIIAVLYLFTILINHKNKEKLPEIIILSILSGIFLLGVQNGIYFYLAFLGLILIFYLFATSFSNDTKSLKLYHFYLFFINTFVALGIMLLGMFSHSFNFSEMVKSLISNANHSNAIFALFFLGFGLPAVLSNRIIDKFLVNEEHLSNEINLLGNIFYITYFYCLLRFTGMGAVPLHSNLYITLIILFGITFFDIFKLFKTNNITEQFLAIKYTQTNFSLIALLIGSAGYVYKLPIISIIGYSTSLLFAINSIFTSNILKDGNKSFKPIVTLGILNSNFIPATLGFYSWGMLLFACYLGIISNVQNLKILSITILILTLLLIGIQFLKSIRIIKNIFTTPITIKNKLPNLSFIYALFALVFGLFPDILYKIIIVPTSFWVGGTNYTNLFNAVRFSIKSISLYIFLIFALLMLYILGRFIVVKILHKKTPPNK